MGVYVESEEGERNDTEPRARSRRVKNAGGCWGRGEDKRDDLAAVKSVDVIKASRALAKNDASGGGLKNGGEREIRGASARDGVSRALREIFTPPSESKFPPRLSPPPFTRGAMIARDLSRLRLRYFFARVRSIVTSSTRLDILVSRDFFSIFFFIITEGYFR